MKLSLSGMLLCSLLAALVLPSPVWSQRRDTQGAVRTLTGQVTDSSGSPLPDAIVYLKNAKDLSVKTYIADRDGNYRFNALSPNVDYEVYAEHKGRRSEVRTLSSFDSRKQATLHLRIK